MNQVRLVVLAVGCLIGSVFLFVRCLSGLPALKDLTEVSGVVRFGMETVRSRRSTTDYPVLILDGSPTRYKYLVWFPKSDEITRLVRAGAPVTIWTDKGRNDWVWQIEQYGELVVPYSDIRHAAWKNQQFDWIAAGVMLVLGIAATVGLFRQHKTVEEIDTREPDVWQRRPT